MTPFCFLLDSAIICCNGGNLSSCHDGYMYGVAHRNCDITLRVPESLCAPSLPITPSGLQGHETDHKEKKRQCSGHRTLSHQAVTAGPFLLSPPAHRLRFPGQDTFCRTRHQEDSSRRRLWERLIRCLPGPRRPSSSPAPTAVSTAACSMTPPPPL